MLTLEGILLQREVLVGAQVVEQHLLLRGEEIAPASGEMIEERLLVLQQLVMTSIKTMDLGLRKIAAEQVCDGRVIEPMPMQSPLLRAAPRRSPSAALRAACGWLSRSVLRLD